jgi:hypothetical protein
MDKLTIFFLMTIDMMSLLVISLDVHVYFVRMLEVHWVAMGHMCNVNMFITSCKRLCFMGS